MQRGHAGGGARAWRAVLVVLALALCAALAQAGGAAQAATYPTMAPLSAYLMPDRSAEIALARSAAPPSVSADAEVLVLGPHGYVSAGPGKNGFVCVVSRSWFSGFADYGFWNPKERGPICFNRQAARSVLPTFLMRTRWALAGASREEMLARSRTAIEAGRIRPPEAGAMTFMLSKDGYLGDDAGGPWHPHVMFYTPPIPLADWGANLPGTRVLGNAAGAGDPYAVFYVPVAVWSDGTRDDNAGDHHTM